VGRVANVHLHDVARDFSKVCAEGRTVMEAALLGNSIDLLEVIDSKTDVVIFRGSFPGALEQVQL
jgi:hypothetical protein